MAWSAVLYGKLLTKIRSKTLVSYSQSTFAVHEDGGVPSRLYRVLTEHIPPLESWRGPWKVGNPLDPPLHPYNYINRLCQNYVIYAGMVSPTTYIPLSNINVFSPVAPYTFNTGLLWGGANDFDVVTISTQNMCSPYAFSGGYR